MCSLFTQINLLSLLFNNKLLKKIIYISLLVLGLVSLNTVKAQNKEIQLLKKVEYLYEEKKHEHTILKLNELMKINPEFVAAYLCRVDNKSELNQFDGELKYYKKVKQLNSLNLLDLCKITLPVYYFF